MRTSLILFVCHGPCVHGFLSLVSGWRTTFITIAMRGIDVNPALAVGMSLLGVTMYISEAVAVAAVR